MQLRILVSGFPLFVGVKVCPNLPDSLYPKCQQPCSESYIFIIKARNEKNRLFFVIIDFVFLIF